MSIHFINALNGPVVTNGSSKRCGQESYVLGMSQSREGTVACVHGDVYTASG